MSSRLVCQFSCGAASAVATKIILAERPASLMIVNAFLKEEHADNRRFLADCERWFNHPITVLRDETFSASTDMVWEQRKFIKGPKGAPCSWELKRKLLAQVMQPGDTTVFGYTAEEEDRLYDMQEKYPDELFRAPLIERGLSKQDCWTMLTSAGIELPAMYKLGYRNANCIGCPKGGQAYWQHIRKDFPERFAAVQSIQEGIAIKAAENGNQEDGAFFLRFRSGPRKGERMALSELPAGLGDMGAEPDFSCSFVCAMVENEWAKP